MSSFFTSASSSTAATAVADKDIEVADPPTDSISSLAFSPQADYLAVGSWDNNVRLPRVCFCIDIEAVPVHFRSGYMKWAQMARRKERPCMGTKALC